METPRKKAARKPASRKNKSSAEDIVRAVQGVAVAGAALYKIIKPHVQKLRRKPAKPKPPAKQ